MKRQQGSAHIIILVVIVVIIVGLLGYVLWRNFIKADSSTNGDGTSKTVTKTDTNTDINDVNTNTATSTSGQPSTSSNSSGSSEVKLVSNQFFSSDNLGIKYELPSTWTGGKFGGGDTLSDTESTTLTAPDGFVINMTISRLVRGWGPEDPQATVLEVQKTSASGIYWVIVDHNAGTTGPISLQIASNPGLPAVGDKKVAGSSIYKLGTADGSSVYLEMYGGYASDMSLKDFNNKESVKQAKAIFESIRIGV